MIKTVRPVDILQNATGFASANSILHEHSKAVQQIRELQKLTPPSPDGLSNFSSFDRESKFVEALVDVSAKLVDCLWPVSSNQRVLSLHTFISETLRRSRTSFSTLQLALYYLIRSCAAPRPSNHRCGRRVFLSALMVATKFLQDQTYSTRAWSKISGLGCTEINRNETDLLLRLDYKLALSSDDFTSWGRSLTRLASDHDVDAFLRAWLIKDDAVPTAAYQPSSFVDAEPLLLSKPTTKFQLPLSPPESLTSSSPKRGREDEDEGTVRVCKKRRS